MKMNDKEHKAFITHAIDTGLDMEMHPLHLLYISTHTHEALQSFKAGFKANQHDALVAMNAELVEALSELLDAAGSVVNCAYTDYVTQDLEPARTGAIEVLTKAKELSQ